ncbi:MAG TPA: DNA polymerase III subunit delta' [Candidatus Angelobacter sp.]|nr:DNA polymerase III subunit delta' [Candidatus Angelobacter sp.]
MTAAAAITIEAMGFSDFHGNPGTVLRLREMLAQGRLPQSVILAGPEGSGKYTLAVMLARALNCVGPEGTPVDRKSDFVFTTDGLPDFCGQCDNCRKIGEAADLEARFNEAIEAREALRDTDKRETRIFVQTHPDVLVIPPDPPQMMIKVDQVRHVNHTIHYKPAEARRRVFIFTPAPFMKEAANALLKTLEEPPEFATILLLVRNPGELLPTVRSRSAIFTLQALPGDEIERFLARHRPQWNARQRQLVARLSGGAIGRALSFDLEQYASARKDALAVLHTAVSSADHSELFRTTETYRSGAEGKEKTDQLITTTYSLLQDLMALGAGTPELVRNTDITAELKTLAGATDFEWIVRAVQSLGQLQSGMRRNLLRSLSLDAFAVSLEAQD